MTIKFCSQCGHQLVIAVPAGDSLPRAMCENCEYIHYTNPKILVSCLVTWEDKVLWIRRAGNPGQGLWALPSGYMEEHETLESAAVRELYEETNVSIPAESLALYIIGTITPISEVHVVFRAELDNPEYTAGEETIEVGLFAEDEVPWDDFAFPELKDSLRYFYRELKKNKFGVHIAQFTEVGNKTWLIAREHLTTPELVCE